MRQNTLAHTRQGAYALPRSPSRNGGLLLRRRGKRSGPTSKEYGREGREERGDVYRAEGNTCKVQASRTRSSAIAEGPRDALCQLKLCQLPRNSAETTYTTSPDQIDGMKLEI